MRLITDWVEGDEGYQSSHEFDHTFTRRFFFIHQRVRLVKYLNVENYPDDIMTYPHSTALFIMNFIPIKDKYLLNKEKVISMIMIILYEVANSTISKSYTYRFNSLYSPKLWKILNKKYTFFERFFKDRVRDKKLNELGI